MHRLGRCAASFTPFSLECPPAPTYELQAIVKAQEKANEAIVLAQNLGAEKAAHLAKRAVDHISMVQGWFTFYAYRMYSDLQDNIHEARFDLEQAAQSAYSEASGSEAGNLLSCAADDLLPYDPVPNIHPMDHRLSCLPGLSLISLTEFADVHLSKRGKRASHFL